MLHQQIVKNLAPVFSRVEGPAKVLPAKAHHHPVKLMGCMFTLTAVHHEPQIAWDALRAGVQEITRIEDLISSWKSESQTGEINSNAGVCAVKVDPELFYLIKRSLAISEMTAGAFDISGTLSRDYYNFDGQAHPVLPAKKIHELRDLIFYRNIILNDEDHSVYLKKAGMKIGFGGIGKGYAAQKAQAVMQSYGIENGLVNASGDIICWGRPPGKELWDIHIPDPDQLSKSLFQLALPFGALVTSGDYENFVLMDGVRYSHIVDPRTGLPCKGLKSVSVVCPNAEFADAIATAISVMGVKAGIRLVDRLNGVECLLIDQDNQQHYSRHLQDLLL